MITHANVAAFVDWATSYFRELGASRDMEAEVTRW
jgi:hypothetical protein